jgi:hypothetical protein
MCTSLGANFNYFSESFKPFFVNPITKENCFVFFDLCYMIKLVRNTFADKKILSIKQDDVIQWIQCLEGEKTGDGISYASHVKNPNPLKARATTFYDPVHNMLDKEAQCAWKEGKGIHWSSVYIQKPFMTL